MTAEHTDNHTSQLYDRLKRDLEDEIIIGYKIGATNEPARQMLGLESPFYAYLLESRLHQSGETVFLPKDIDTVLVEPEICYELHPIQGKPNEPGLLIARTWLAIEIVSPPGGSLKGLEYDTLVQSNGIHFCLIRDHHALTLDTKISSDMPVTVMVNAEKKAKGSPANVYGHPCRALEWLLKMSSVQLPEGIPGLLVTTGSCTEGVPARRGDSIKAVFGELGEVLVVLS